MMEANAHIPLQGSRFERRDAQGSEPQEEGSAQVEAWELGLSSGTVEQRWAMLNSLLPLLSDISPSTLHRLALVLHSLAEPLLALFIPNANNNGNINNNEVNEQHGWGMGVVGLSGVASSSGRLEHWEMLANLVNVSVPLLPTAAQFMLLRHYLIPAAALIPHHLSLLSSNITTTALTGSTGSQIYGRDGWESAAQAYPDLRAVLPHLFAPPPHSHSPLNLPFINIADPTNSNTNISSSSNNNNSRDKYNMDEQRQQCFSAGFEPVAVRHARMYAFIHSLCDALPPIELTHADSSRQFVQALQSLVEVSDWSLWPTIMTATLVHVVFQCLKTFLNRFPHCVSVMYPYIRNLNQLNNTKKHSNELVLKETILLIQDLSSVHHEMSSLLHLLNQDICKLNSDRLTDYLEIVVLISREESISPSEMIQTLIRCKKHQSIAFGWDQEDMLLNICRNFMITYPTHSVVQQLSQLLVTVSTTTNYLEIRDRSNFLYQLLSHIPSHTKLNQILGCTSLGDEETAGIVSAVQLGQDSKHTTTDSVIFNITRTQTKKLSEQQPNSFVKGSSLPSAIDYINLINTQQEYINLEYTIQYSIPEPQQNLNTKLLNEKKTLAQRNSIFGIILSFPPNENYQSISDIRIPYLNETPLGSQNITQSWPYSYKFNLIIQPLYPMPTIFQPTTVFNDSSGGTISSNSVSPIIIRFQDLILPLIQTTQEHLEEVWKELWQKCEGEKCGHTVKLVEKDGAALTQRLQTLQLEAHVTYHTPHRAHLLLPVAGRRVLLLDIQLQDSSSHVSARTDSWQLLAFLDPFFDLLQL